MTTKKTGAPHESAPEESFETERKDTHFFQLQRTQLAFFEKPITMKQASLIVGCDRANTCRYVKTMKKANAIWIVRLGRCPITRHSKVQFLTTNPRFAESLPKQLTLF